MPVRMSRRRRPPVVVAAAFVLALAALGPVEAAAQTRDTPRDAPRPVSFGGEIAATAGPRDTSAFFNYTDYEHNALRVVRLRLFGEWRLAPTIAFVGELRSEDGDGVEAAAIFARVRPWPGRPFALQVGRIPPVIGAFARRAYGRDNPLLGMPLAYQYLTSLRPDALPATADDLLRMRGRGWRPRFPIGNAADGPGLPLVSASRWSTGIEGLWQGRWLDAAGAWSLGPPAAPTATDTTAGRQWSGRVAFHLPAGLSAGVSGARGRWIDREVLGLLPDDRREPSSQSLIALDAEFGEGPWLIRAEWLRSVFGLPLAGGPQPAAALSAVSGFVEARYRFHPRWQTAVRVDRLAFGTISGTLEGGLPTDWDAEVDRVEVAVAFRASRQIELRGGWQHNWRDRGRVTERGFPAAQVLFWF